MIQYKSGYKYQLQESFRITLDWLPEIYAGDEWIALAQKDITIQKGYAWDGPSGPTYDSKESMTAALVHDALYQLMREGYLWDGYRKQADETFYKLCIEKGMNRIRAWFWYKAVRFAAGPMAKNGTERPILTAP